MEVLKQISPKVVPLLPSDFPWKTVPSASNKTAGTEEKGFIIELIYSRCEYSFCDGLQIGFCLFVFTEYPPCSSKKKPGRRKPRKRRKRTNTFFQRQSAS